jgi:hypothetical protein
MSSRRRPLFTFLVRMFSLHQPWITTYGGLCRSSSERVLQSFLFWCRLDAHTKPTNKFGDRQILFLSPRSPDSPRACGAGAACTHCCAFVGQATTPITAAYLADCLQAVHVNIERNTCAPACLRSLTVSSADCARHCRHMGYD